MLVVLLLSFIFCAVFSFVVYKFYLKAVGKFKLGVLVSTSNDTFNRKYFCLKDEVADEMLFSPFTAQNSACAIRQVQEVIASGNMLPKSLKPEDVGLYYCFTINGRSLIISDGYKLGDDKVLRLCSCDEDSLKKAYQLHKEVK